MQRPSQEKPAPRRRVRKRRRGFRRVWNGFVMLAGYAAILYFLARGVVYLLVLAEEWM